MMSQRKSKSHLTFKKEKKKIRKRDQLIRSKDSKNDAIRQLRRINSEFSPFCHGTDGYASALINKHGFAPQEIGVWEESDIPAYPNRVYFGSVSNGFGGCRSAMEEAVEGGSIPILAYLDGVFYIWKSIPEEYAEYLTVDEDCESDKSCITAYESLDKIGSFAVKFSLGKIFLKDGKTLNFVKGNGLKYERYKEDEEEYEYDLNEVLPSIEKNTKWDRDEIESFLEEHKNIFIKAGVIPKIDIYSKNELDILLLPNIHNPKFNIIHKYFQNQGFQVSLPTKPIKVTKQDFNILTPKEFFYFVKYFNSDLFLLDTWENFILERMFEIGSDPVYMNEKFPEIFEDISDKRKSEIKKLAESMM